MRIDTTRTLCDLAGEIASRPHPPVKISVSMGTCGIAAGTGPVLEALRAAVAERHLENAVEISEVGCMGLCYAEPVLMVSSNDGSRRLIYGDVTPQQIPAILDAGVDSIAPGTRTIERNWYYPEWETPAPGELQARIVLRNTGRLCPENLEEYIAADGYAALGKIGIAFVTDFENHVVALVYSRVGRAVGAPSAIGREEPVVEHATATCIDGVAGNGIAAHYIEHEAGV